MTRRISDQFWSFQMGLLVGVPTGMLGGVLLVSFFQAVRGLI